MIKTAVPISGKTRIFGTIAHPASHVRAPSLFNPVFAEKQIDAVMVPLDVHPDGLAAAAAALRMMPNFGGLAVTIPHKMTLAALCDELSPVAKITGAVNAVRVQDGRLLGENFDGAGFVSGLKQQQHQLEGKRILMIGAGGAARAIAHALSLEPIASLSIYNRTAEKAAGLISAVQDYVPNAALEVAGLDDLSAYDMIINATALGLNEGDAMPCSLDDVKSDCLICDIIMVPEQTKWLAHAQDKGLACHYGRHMLDCQFSMIAEFLDAFDKA